MARLFRPEFHYDRVSTINLDTMWADGIRGFIMDLDNTLVPWRSSEIPEDVMGWAKRATDQGFKICIASNTRRYTRLGIVAAALGASFVRGVTKPRRGGFRAALLAMELPLEQVAVIGDQLLTDILAAKRLGVRAILVDRISVREFIVTKFNRQVERVIVWLLERTGDMPKVVHAIEEAADK